MTQHDDVRLRHMLDAARKAASKASGKSAADIAADEDLLLILTRLLEILGEAAKNVSPEIRERHPEIPWKQISGTRDRVIHRYFDVDPEVIWRIATEELPSLIPKLQEATQSGSA
ncbi:MAG: HepT-like ribonuclease domain-containing protein [Thermoanaerobaculia bacterium]